VRSQGRLCPQQGNRRRDDLGDRRGIPIRSTRRATNPLLQAIKQARPRRLAHTCADCAGHAPATPSPTGTPTPLVTATPTAVPTATLAPTANPTSPPHPPTANPVASPPSPTATRHALRPPRNPPRRPQRRRPWSRRPRCPPGQLALTERAALTLGQLVLEREHQISTTRPQYAGSRAIKVARRLER